MRLNSTQSMFKILHFFLLLFVSVLAQDHPIPRLIISPWAFFDVCDDSDPYNTSKMSGIEFNVVRDAFKIAGYEEGVDFIFECLPWPDCTDAVYNAVPEDNVLGLIEALPINAADLSGGYSYSQGTLQTGFGVGYFRNTSSTHGVSNWFFVRPYTASLYAMMLIIPVVFAFFLWFYEGRNMPFLNYLYHLIVYYFKLEFLKRLKVESRIIEFIFQLYGMVVIIAYTSMMVDIIAVTKANGVVQTPNDLRGLRMTTDVTYLDYVSAVNGRPVEIYQPGDPTTVEEFIVALERQEVAYYLFENAIIEALAAADCRFSVVLLNVIQINFGILWSKFAPQGMKDKLDIALIKAFDEKNLAARVSEGIKAASTQQCLNPTTRGSNQILIDDVYGLWVIWCLCLALATLLKVISLIKGQYGQKLFTIYDLEIRGSQEKKIMGEINSQTTCLALVSRDMIRKTRQQAVYTCLDFFNLMSLSEKTRAMMFALVKNDPELKHLLMVPTGLVPSKTQRRTIFGALKDKFAGRRSIWKSKNRSMTDISIPSLQTLGDATIPTSPDRPSKRFFRERTQSMNQLDGDQRRSSVKADLSLILPTNVRRRRTKILTANLSDKLLKYNPKSPRIVHYELSGQKAKEIADYYYRKAADIEAELKKLHEESKQLNRTRSEQKHHTALSIVTPGLASSSNLLRYIPSNDKEVEDEELKSPGIETTTQRFNLISSPRTLTDDFELSSPRSPRFDDSPLSTRRGLISSKRDLTNFNLSPIAVRTSSNSRKCLAPFTYKENTLKQFSKGGSKYFPKE